MDRLRDLKVNPNLSNISQGYETAQDESEMSTYYSLNGDGSTDDESKIATVPKVETISPDRVTQLQYTNAKPNMTDAACQHTIPEIVFSHPTLPESRQFLKINEICSTSIAAASHSEFIDGVEVLTITPQPHVTAPISNEFINIFPIKEVKTASPSTINTARNMVNSTVDAKKTSQNNKNVQKGAVRRFNHPLSMQNRQSCIKNTTSILVPATSTAKMELRTNTLSNANRKRGPETKDHVCGVCRKSFMRMTDLNSHKKSHKLSYMCKYCGKNFEKVTALDTHLLEKCLKIPSREHRKLNTGAAHQPVASSSGATSSASETKMPHSGIFRTPSKVHRCQTCGEQFKEFNSFHDHAATHDKAD